MMAASQATVSGAAQPQDPEMDRAHPASSRDGSERRRFSPPSLAVIMAALAWAVLFLPALRGRAQDSSPSAESKSSSLAGPAGSAQKSDSPAGNSTATAPRSIRVRVQAV